MKGWMHLNKRSWGQIKKRMFDDLGERVRDDMKEEFRLLPDYYYHCSKKVDSIVWDDSAKVIGVKNTNKGKMNKSFFIEDICIKPYLKKYFFETSAKTDYGVNKK